MSNAFACNIIRTLHKETLLRIETKQLRIKFKLKMLKKIIKDIADIYPDIADNI